MSMNFHHKLPIPQQIKEQFPVTEALAKRREEIIGELGDIFSGKSNKFLLIIGPCSADSEAPVLDYISRLRKVQDKVNYNITIVPRI